MSDRPAQETRDMVIAGQKKQWEQIHRRAIPNKKLREIEKMVIEKVMPGTAYNKKK